MTRLQKSLAAFGILAISAALAFPGPASKATSRTKPQPVSDQGLAPIASAFKAAGVRYKPEARRDPFLNPLAYRKKNAPPPDEEVPRGTPPPGIAGMFIEQVMLLGTSLQPDGGRKAIFQGTDTRAYFLQQGDKLFDGYVKSIGVDSVVLVRVTKLRSGKVLARELTKSLRTS
jgi:hypothetical protein